MILKFLKHFLTIEIRFFFQHYTLVSRISPWTVHLLLIHRETKSIIEIKSIFLIPPRLGDRTASNGIIYFCSIHLRDDKPHD